jgi:hypothetical protein
LAAYEFRLLNKAERIVRSVLADYADDEAALAAIRPFAGMFPIEVWTSERLVHRFESRAG